MGIFLSLGQAGYEQAVTHKRPIMASNMQAKAGENMPSSIRPARMSTGEKRRLTYTPMGPNDNVGSTPSNQPQMGGNTNTGGEVEGMSETYMPKREIHWSHTPGSASIMRNNVSSGQTTGSVANTNQSTNTG